MSTRSLALLYWLAIPGALVASGIVISKTDRPTMTIQIREEIDRYNATTSFPLPLPEDARLTNLFEGEVVRFYDKWTFADAANRTRQRHRVLAFKLVAAPRLVVWLSMLDPHFGLDDRITDIRLTGDTLNRTLYQFMDLPWPVANRHWIIDVNHNVNVSSMTSGHVWELSWHLVRDGEKTARKLADDATSSGRPFGGRLSSDDVYGATYLEANDGAWAIISLRKDLTLIAYNLTIVLGGLIPEGLAARFAMMSLKDLLERVASNVVRVPQHYSTGHVPIYAGDGSQIPPGILTAATE